MKWRLIGVLGVSLLACSDAGETRVPDAIQGFGVFGENISHEQLFTEGAGERVFREVAYDTLWSYGGPQDTLLAGPLRMAASPGGGVYVLDAVMQKVYRFSDGRLVWSWGSVGSGPGEIRNVRAMDADPETGGVVLVDSGNRRIIQLSGDGSLLGEARITIPSPLLPTVAALGAGHGYVVGTANVAFPVLRLANDGGFVREIPAPWNGFLSKNFLQVTGSVFSAGGGKWGFAFETGNGWFVYPSGDVGSPVAYPYVEHVNFPEMISSRKVEGESVQISAEFATRPTYSGYDVDVKADTFFVLSGGSNNREKLDVYMVRDGRYVETRSLPGRFTRVAISGDTVFVLDRRGISPVILSLHPQERPQ